MKEFIKVIAFDADDTLWSNEPFFQEVEKQYVRLLEPYGTPKEISAALFQTEMNNLKILGYGAKAFTISMVETALRISEQKISADTIQQIIALGKSLLEMPIELLPGVKETLKTLKEKGKYKLVVATKGDLLDQENKLERRLQGRNVRFRQRQSDMLHALPPLQHRMGVTIGVAAEVHRHRQSGNVGGVRLDVYRQCRSPSA